MSNIENDRKEILAVHGNWWRANERWDIPLMQTCFPVGPNYLMFNYNWHPYFGIEEKVRLWEYYKDSGMTMEPPDVRIMKFEVIGDIAYLANEFEIRTTMPAQPNALIEEAQALPQAGETMTDRGRSTEIYKRDDGEGRPIWKMWHFHCSPLPPADALRPGFNDTAQSRGGLGSNPWESPSAASVPIVLEPYVTPPAISVQGPAGCISVIVMDRDSAAGTNTCVVLLHPVNLTARCWMPVASLLGDFNRVLIDSRGHGRSHMNGPFGVDDYAADVRAVIETLGLRAIHMVGASLGGSIACAVAAALPGIVKSLVAVGASLEPADPDSLAHLEHWRNAGAAAELFDAFLEQEISHGLSPSAAADARRQVGLDTRREDLIKNITWNAFAEDARRYAGSVHCPALVLTGEHDESCPPATGERMAAALGAPFEILPGLGHLPMMQAPSIVAGRLATFIGGVMTQ